MSARPPLLVLALLCGSCAPVPRALAPEAAAARQASDELFSALADRFGPVELDARFAAARPRLARAGLVPSRVYEDAAIWTGAAGAVRELGFHGVPAKGAYSIAVAERPPAPSRAGEYRGRLALERLRKGEFEWRMDEELGLGRIDVLGLTRAADALLALAEAADLRDARDPVRAALPRTTAALGRVLSLDRLTLGPREAGARLVEAGASLHPEWLEQRLPRYAEFLKGHVASMRLGVAVDDAAETPFWQADLRDGRLSLRLRVGDGALAPLLGPPRRLGDACRVRLAITMKSGLFRVGFEDLHGEVVVERGPHRAGFLARFAREPDWKLPFFVEPFMRGPLRRPFEGPGALLGYELRDGSAPGASATASRSYRLDVKESWIVRWLGGNVGGAVADFRRGAEREADVFTREALLALRDDLRSLIEAAPAP